MRTTALILASIGTVTASWSGRNSATVKPPSFIQQIRGGANEYETKFESAKSDVLEKAFRKVIDCLCNKINRTKHVMGNHWIDLMNLGMINLTTFSFSVKIIPTRLKKPVEKSSSNPPQSPISVPKPRPLPTLLWKNLLARHPPPKIMPPSLLPTHVNLKSWRPV